MKQSKYFSRWKPRYFRLEDGFLTYYDKKALVGTHKNKVVMSLDEASRSEGGEVPTCRILTAFY